MNNQLLANIQTNWINKKFMISLSKNMLDRQLVLDYTSWINSIWGEQVPLKIRCLLIANDYTIDTLPTCRTCGKPTSYDKSYQLTLNAYCSSSCRHQAETRLPIDTYDNLRSYEWLYQKRIVEQYSYDRIAATLQCSANVVKKWAKLHKLPLLKYNESAPMSQAMLRDAEWLKHQHQTLHRPLHEIADELHSSVPTVSRWLQYHGIQANAANSYDRTANYNSKESIEVFDFLTALGVELQVGNRTILNGLELDFVDHSRKIAIEYNGIYSHLFRPEESNFSKRKDRNYHLTKTIRSAEAGYTLLHIFSDDWVMKKEIWKSILRSKFGISTHRIGARKCSIVTLDSHQKNQFLIQNHLQGKDSSSLNYALMLDDKIVSVMTFSNSRYNSKYNWELIRFASVLDHQVVGGFSKLLSHFRKHHLGSIISYADRGRSLGNVYSANGFTAIKINPPSYWYVNLNKSIKRLHRSAFAKSKITYKGDPKTEEQIMFDNGYSKIWDCGTIAFVLQ